MGKNYRVDQSFGGGYTVRESDFVEDTMIGAAGIAGNLIGAPIGGLRTLARNRRDRIMAQAADEMVAAANAEQFDRLLHISVAFWRQYPQEVDGPAFACLALAGTKQYSDALSVLEKSVQLGLDPLQAAMMRADIYAEMGDIAKWINECASLIQNNETRQHGYLSRAQALMQLGDFEQALADVNHAISLSPDAFGYFLRGHIYGELDQLQKALDDFTRADRLQPNNEAILEARADAYELLGKPDEAQAIRQVVEQMRSRSTVLGSAAIAPRPVDTPQPRPPVEPVFQAISAIECQKCRMSFDTRAELEQHLREA